MRLQELTVHVFVFDAGKKQYNNLIAVHSNRELIVYSSLLVGYGMWGDTIYVAENRRHMGKMRYPGLFSSRRYPEFHKDMPKLKS